jgi:hypothetical protein
LAIWGPIVQPGNKTSADDNVSQKRDKVIQIDEARFQLHAGEPVPGTS